MNHKENSKKRFSSLLVVLFIGLAVGNHCAFGSEPAGSNSRVKKIPLLQKRIDNAATPAQKIELERVMANLWLGEGCPDSINTDRFKAEAKRILEEYKSVSYHYCFLDVKVTYAQLLSAEKGKMLLWEVIAFDPREIQPPEGENPADWVNRLKQGAIWAYLNSASCDAVSAKPSVQNRRFREEADKLVARLEKTEEGRRCIPLATWWENTVTGTQRGSVSIPKLEPPPASKWDDDDDTDKTPEPASQAVVPTATTKPKPKPKPKDIRFQRSFDSVKYEGTVTIPTESNSSFGWLPWVLGGAGVLMLLAGLAMKRKQSHRKS